MKIAIVVGHNRKAQGAVRIVDGRTEFDWNGELAEHIRDCDPDSVGVFFRNPGAYSRQIDDVYAQVDAWEADVSIELHFNGSVDPKATGCLTLSSGSRRSRILASEVHTRMREVIGNEDDGIQIRSKGARGGRSLHAGRAPAILAEPYFGGNERFCHVADANIEELAEAIYEGAVAAIRCFRA